MACQLQPAVCAHVDIQKRNIELTQVFVRQSGRVAADRYRNVATVFRLISAHQIGYFLAKAASSSQTSALIPVGMVVSPFGWSRMPDFSNIIPCPKMSSDFAAKPQNCTVSIFYTRIIRYQRIVKW